MSINKFQEKVFRTGCGSAVLYVCAAVFFGGIFYLGCGVGGGANGRSGDENRAVVMTVAGRPVYYEEYSQNIQKMRDYSINQAGKGGSPDAIPPQQEAQIEADILNQYITAYGTVYLVKQAGGKFSDDSIRSVFEEQNEESIASARTGLISSHKLKADANDKEFDAAMKKEGRQTPTEVRAQFKKDIANALKDDSRRKDLEQAVARALLVNLIQGTMKPTDEELKAHYTTYNFKRVLFSMHAGSTVDSQIAKAQADLKAGKTFEEVVDRYSGDPPVKGKKLSENTTDIAGSTMDMIPYYKSLKGFKVGQVSDVIETPQGKSIYKLAGTTSSAPDLPTNRAKYVNEYTKGKAQEEVTKRLKAFTTSDQVAWKMQGPKALFDWFLLEQDQMAPPAEKEAKMAAIVDEAKKAITSNQTDSRPASLAWYVAFDGIWMTAKDKTKLRGDRIEMLKAVTSTQPYFSLKIELVDLLIESKAYPEAIDSLKSAAASNFMFDTEGQKDYGDVQARIITLKNANALKPADEADLAKIQKDWVAQKEQADKDKAAQKAAEEASKKEQAANEAKQKAAADKQKAEADKAKGGKPGSASVPAPTAGADKGVTSKGPPGAPIITAKVAGPADKTSPPATKPPGKKQ